MPKNQSKTTFVDLKFFLGLLFMIYGLLLAGTGFYYTVNPISGIDSSIDVYWGLLMLTIGAINYYKSDKPSNWNKAFAISGINQIEKRLKGILEETVEEV
ncbi:MAG: hypothetical protein P8Y18_00075 [Candidatus Bathyarchaeota archaeon]